MIFTWLNNFVNDSRCYVHVPILTVLAKPFKPITIVCCAMLLFGCDCLLVWAQTAWFFISTFSLSCITLY